MAQIAEEVARVAEERGFRRLLAPRNEGAFSPAPAGEKAEGPYEGSHCTTTESPVLLSSTAPYTKSGPSVDVQVT